MPTHDLAAWRHSHAFDGGNQAAERGTMLVMWITLTMMVIEISSGWWFNSMALLADGWHMGSHALAIGLSAFAYVAARRYAADARFAFGTFKIEVLAGFASSLLLLVIAVLMVVGSVERILWPQEIRYQEAIAVAVLGLAVNVACAMVLGKAHDHGHDHHHLHHDHGRDHDHAGHEHHDLNLRAAYMHVIADAATSVLAIVALTGGWLFGWAWLDPVMGIVGAILISIWARTLIVQTGKVLLDREMDAPVVAEIRRAVETGPDEGNTRIADLHVWRVGKRAYACALSLVTHDAGLTPARVHEQLAAHDGILHATVEIHVRPASP
ncbi:MAG: CDF family Co(II)/Ni(II) efflux transporter DmeF [Gammaproteobacteria bacterium]